MPPTGIKRTDMHQATAEVESFLMDRIESSVKPMRRVSSSAAQPAISCHPLAITNSEFNGGSPLGGARCKQRKSHITFCAGLHQRPRNPPLLAAFAFHPLPSYIIALS